MLLIFSPEKKEKVYCMVSITTYAGKQAVTQIFAFYYVTLNQFFCWAFLNEELK